MAGLRFSKRDGMAALAIFASVLCLYWLSAWKMDRTRTPSSAYFNELALSFLHGRLSLEQPADTHDLTPYQGRWYVPFLPLPALLMLPWAAAFGSVNTVVFSVILGALNVALVFLILRALAAAGRIPLKAGDAVWLAVLFGFGTVHWYVSTMGSVWFVSQVCTVTCIALAVVFAAGARSPLLAGASLAAAMWARPTAVLAYPLIIAIGWTEAQESAPPDKRAFLFRWAAWSILPLCVSAAGLLGYNWLRFDNPLDFGYLTQNVADFLRQDLNRYGQFSVQYLGRNLQTMLFALPKWNSGTGAFVPEEAGMSLLITTPALVYLVRARQRAAIVLGAWLSILLILVPLLTYYNAGWAQFGYRFSLDFMVPAMVLLAYAVQRRAPLFFRILVVVSAAVNLWGLLWYR